MTSVTQSMCRFKLPLPARALWLLAAMTVLAGCRESEAQVALPYAEAEIHQPDELRVRLFWQDRADATLKWADVYSGKTGN